MDCRLPYYQMGGISQYVLHLLPALAALDRENQYTVFHSRKDGRSHTPAATNFYRRNLWTPCHHRLERWALTAELLPHRLDVLHSPDFIPPQGGAKRRIITVHDLNFLYYPQFLTAESRRYYNQQIAWAVKTADHISADSHATRHDLINLLQVPAEKVTTIHLAANPMYEARGVRNEERGARSEEREARSEERGFRPSPFALRPSPFTPRSSPFARPPSPLPLPPSPFILFVGTLEPRKNLPMLIRVYHQLRQEKRVDVPLVLVGKKGWLYEEIFDTIRQLDLQEQVIHLPGISDDQLVQLYQMAGVLVTPSFYEGFGLPALEAQHCGCPVIVSNRGSLPEIVGPQGIQLDPDDESAWARAIEQVLTDTTLRQQMVQTGYAQAKTFSWQKTAELTLTLYLTS